MSTESAAAIRDPMRNPFAPEDTARHAIWEMLVPRDIDAYLGADWGAIRDDFIAENFTGMNGNFDDNPQNWSLSFADLDNYRDEWLRQAQEGQKADYAEDPRAAIFAATRLEEIEIDGKAALVRKKFDGQIRRTDGSADRLLWQTLYICRETDSGWKIAGFVGYLPYAGH